VRKTAFARGRDYKQHGPNQLSSASIESGKAWTNKREGGVRGGKVGGAG